MKIAVLYTHLSGYISACLESFVTLTGDRLLITALPPAKNAPFAADRFSKLGQILDRSKFEQKQIEEQIRAFQPDAILVSGWIDPAYNRICRNFKAMKVPVIAGCDTQWKGSLRQRAATLLAPWHINGFIDVLWVTGERQRQLAWKLGYRGIRCWDGFYACDWNRFASNTETMRLAKIHSFLYVGRYVREKGIQDLAEAYSIYRKKVEDPWPLICVGKGELAGVLTATGIEDRGFIQPESLSHLMHQSSAFVLPSRIEPWGVVVQEAAAAGLPLVVSQACGASVHLVRDNYNGYVTETGNAQNLAAALIRMHSLSEAERQEFGLRSFDLSKQYTPERWNRILRDGLALLCTNPKV